MNENKHYVYFVTAYYDMNIGGDEEIIQEIYATEELAQQRVKELIVNYKEHFGNNTNYADEWDETEFALFAYEDSKWNVDISYSEEKVRTE